MGVAGWAKPTSSLRSYRCLCILLSYAPFPSPSLNTQHRSPRLACCAQDPVFPPVISLVYFSLLIPLSLMMFDCRFVCSGLIQNGGVWWWG